ncbi:MAG: carotenoid 1,2-hydratase [Opitutae bacterium]|nr:carotenoid 1,2-hydratase [Opitutae bacterium]
MDSVVEYSPRKIFPFWITFSGSRIFFRSCFCRLLELSEKMKFLVSTFFLLALTAEGEWIRPPEHSAKGYLVPSPDYQPVFPRDHGAHRDYGLEWWYWIGHLQAVEDQRKFGFQATVFRVAGEAGESGENNSGSFGDRQLYLAHSALSDLNNEKYLHTERVMREGWQGKISTETLSLKVAGIEASLLEGENGHRVSAQLPNGGSLELELRPKKPLVRFGERGLSRKGDEPASVSWYWTYTRLQVNGNLKYMGKDIPVKGLAWMDHEISSSQLGKGLAGWDWTCMQLDDGTEVKAYRLRKEDGGSDRWSAVYWINPQGETTKVYADDFSWSADKVWVSPKTKLRFPTSVTIQARHPHRGILIYRLRPLLNNQEFFGNRSDNAYWEGACEVLNEEGSRIGNAYLELAGYGGGLGARLN